MWIMHVRENRRWQSNGQSRETGNIGYTRHRANIIVRENQKGQSRMDNPEKLTTLGTKYTGRK